MRQKKICIVCEQAFYPAQGNQVYCSHKCKRVANQATQTKNRSLKRKKASRLCEICGKEFIPFKGVQVTCSDVCRSKRYNVTRNSRRATKVPRVCTSCGETFMVAQRRIKSRCDACIQRVREEKEQRREYLLSTGCSNIPWSLSFDPYETGALRSDAQFLPVL